LRRDIQIIFQDPFGALNPRMSVADILSEPFEIHEIGRGGAIRPRVLDLLDRVGLARAHADRPRSRHSIGCGCCNHDEISPKALAWRSGVASAATAFSN
jgi:ABC-type microcin C transport system duplicated ATPase subunit YejF